MRLFKEEKTCMGCMVIGEINRKLALSVIYLNDKKVAEMVVLKEILVGFQLCRKIQCVSIFSVT